MHGLYIFQDSNQILLYIATILWTLLNSDIAINSEFDKALAQENSTH